MKDALAALEAGQIVAFPTDTVYGIGCRLDRPDAIAALRRIKGRERDKPLQVLVADVDGITDVADASGVAGLDELLPGPVMVVLRARPGLPDLGATGGTVGVRVPGHPVALELLAACGPLVASSANLSGMPTPRTMDGVRAVFGDAVSVYVDGPPAPGGTASTAVDLTAVPPRIVREGAVPASDVLRVVAR